MKSKISDPAVVYVVTARRNPLDEDDPWIAGVYLTEDEAKRVVEERRRVRQAWDAWEDALQDTYLRAFDRFKAEQGQTPWQSPTHFSQYLAADEAKTPSGPEPEREEAEECFYRAIPVGRWLGPDETEYDPETQKRSP